MRKYTEKIHAINLLGMLSTDNPCDICALNGDRDATGDFIPTEDTCDICKSFVGINKYKKTCPCPNLGKSEAIKRTWLALEEKGYLE